MALDTTRLIRSLADTLREVAKSLRDEAARDQADAHTSEEYVDALAKAGKAVGMLDAAQYAYNLADAVESGQFEEALIKRQSPAQLTPRPRPLRWAPRVANLLVAASLPPIQGVSHD